MNSINDTQEIPPGRNWNPGKSGDGVGEIICNNWSGFNEFVANAMTRIHSNVFRGQAKSSWKLRSTLDRTLDNVTVDETGKEQKRFFLYHKLRINHLASFKHASRGRVGTLSVNDMDDDHWWALGQHYGLCTPLLDWTESPYVAAFFAFHEPSHGEDGFASIYCLSRPMIENRIRDYSQELGGEFDPGDVIRFISPLVGDNARLISQRGLFTIGPGEKCLTEWVRTFFKGRKETPLVVIKIPRSQRQLALRQLNRMNVSAMTLFPDLQGASTYCNTKLIDHLY